MRPALPVLLLALLAGCSTLVEREPARGPFRLDGSLDAAEFGPSRPGLARASTRDAWWFGVRNDSHSVVNLYLLLGDELHILHASGSLGRAVYRRDGDEWQLVSGFTWTARDPVIRPDRDAAQAGLERLDLLGRERWTGATFRMGRDFETELRLQRDYPGLDPRAARLAASWLSGPDAEQVAATWPSGATVSEAALALTRGETPARVRFDTARWATLD